MTVDHDALRAYLETAVDTYGFADVLGHIQDIAKERNLDELAANLDTTIAAELGEDPDVNAFGESPGGVEERPDAFGDSEFFSERERRNGVRP